MICPCFLELSRGNVYLQTEFLPKTIIPLSELIINKCYQLQKPHHFTIKSTAGVPRVIEPSEMKHTNTIALSSWLELENQPADDLRLLIAVKFIINTAGDHESMFSTFSRNSSTPRHYKANQSSRVEIKNDFRENIPEAKRPETTWRSF